MDLPTQPLFHIPFAAVRFHEMVNLLIRQVEEREGDLEKSYRDASSLVHSPLRVITGNPEMVMLSRKEKRFQGILTGEGRVIVPDGIGIILAGKLLGRPYPERIAGFDLMTELFRFGAEREWRVYLLGSTPEGIEKARKTIEGKYPRLLVRAHHGYFKKEEETKILEEIASFQPHLLFAGLGVPKQEYWLEEHLRHLPVALGMGVGGSFDVLAGKVKRAPLLWQRMGVEWLYRLIQEPWRWKRMTALPRFLFLVVGERLRGSISHDRP
ncbi:Glycosyl transferase WecB/TagA/CpsF family [[Clostridium] ultunense Esp]|uniref:WecB/TagA/CpsF family glycosyltransferase n=1 Tax=Thermicanus aegyptius TaxID=94009 RepID=UPI0002B70331|nr:WecB/TagA/CpsF family glycosyltransferase [Thermicanus aegyptius]CCQ95753.1 Glycosyl transferase WecB/TagA/CpsF family [[Clostridium] ultunense Esp]